MINKLVSANADANANGNTNTDANDWVTTYYVYLLKLFKLSWTSSGEQKQCVVIDDVIKCAN